MLRDGGKIPGGGKNAMLWRDRSVYDPSQSLHRVLFFHFANLAADLRAAARVAGLASRSIMNQNFIRRLFAALPER